MSEYLKIKSKLESNLTGDQITSILDGLNRQLVYSLNYCTDILTVNYVQLLGWIVLNRKKKVSSLDYTKQISYLYYVLQHPDRSVQHKVFTLLSIDRSFIRTMVGDLLASTSNYEAQYLKYLKGKCKDKAIESYLTRVELALGCNRMHLYPMIQNLKATQALIIDFRERVISKYFKLAYMLSKKHINEAKRHIDAYDLMQNFVKAMLKALDRYNATKGALTSYIRFWILSTQQSAEDSHEYGIAYDIPPNQKLDRARDTKKKKRGSNQNNFSTSLEDLVNTESNIPELVTDNSPEAILTHHSNYLHLLQLAKIADPTGIGRLSLGIEEYFEEEILMEMKSSMLHQGFEVPEKLRNCCDY